ncbi:MAG: dienelactone hydrolase family protein [Candidatus Hydrogenedentes bacterium]|nr:dienelactone hydrolase family protein [Candidatus Hydrogenedentota bacterium]
MTTTTPIRALLGAVVPCLLSTAALAAPALPPSDKTAKEAIDQSPRHGEYAEVPLPGSDVKIKCFVVYPEVKDKAPVVIVIHEIFGMTDWVNSVADAIAAEGFIAVAPDLISGKEGAAENPREAIGKLTDDEVVQRLNAVRGYAVALPAANGRCASIGFCWGGKTTFLYAAAQPKLDAAIVYYGAGPAPEKIPSIAAPVQAHYGQDDARVNATIPDTEAKMKDANKTFEYTVYDGAGHGFLRQQDGRDGANLKASQQAWTKTIEFLKAHTK